MLILSRKSDESITIGDAVTVRVLSISEGHVKLGIVAPREVGVYRTEIYEMVQRTNKEAARAARSAVSKIAGKIPHRRQSEQQQFPKTNIIQ